MALDLDVQSEQTMAPTKRPRTWLGILALLLLPGMTAEMLSGSTPVLVYLTNPISFISNTLLYGCSALLIREVVRRRGLGWASVILLGLAYGNFEEGLVVNTWANPWLQQVCYVNMNGMAVGLCDYSRIGGINVSWALSLTVFHAIVSITIPILLVELLLPRLAPFPWFGRRATGAFVGGDLLVLALGIFINVKSYQQHGFAGPLLAPYLIEIVLMALLIPLALLWPSSRALTLTTPAPRLWTLRVFGFVFLLVNTVLASFTKAANIPFETELIANGVFLALAIWRVGTWAHRSGWGQRHMLALASGALGFFFFIWDVIIEITGSAGGGSGHGTALVALIYLVVLILLARRVRAPRQA